jgi:hypothetical protein
MRTKVMSQHLLSFLFVTSLCFYFHSEASSAVVPKVSATPMPNSSYVEIANPTTCEIKWAPLVMNVGGFMMQYVQLRAVDIDSGDQRAFYVKNGKVLSQDDLASFKRGGDLLNTPEREREVQGFVQELRTN